MRNGPLRGGAAISNLLTLLEKLNEYELMEGVEAYFQQLSGHGCGAVLLLDEYESFLREAEGAASALLWRLRTAVQQPPEQGQPKRLTLVLAGAMEWSAFASVIGSPELNVVTARTVLPPLSAQSFAEMWQHCCDQCGARARKLLDASGVSVTQIYDLTGGWAFTGKVIGHNLVTHGTLDEDKLGRDIHPHFESWWKHRTDAERSQLLSLARGEIAHAGAARELCERGLIEKDRDNSAALRGLLWRRYVQAQLQPGASPTTDAADSPPKKEVVPDDEANLRIRRYLRDSSKPTSRGAAQAAGIAHGRVCQMEAWRAFRDSKKGDQPHRPGRERHARPLTDAMLAARGEDDDPANRLISEEELALRVLRESMGNEEWAAFQRKSKPEKAALIQATVEQHRDQCRDERVR